MDLLLPVKLKQQKTSFEEYCQAIKREEQESLKELEVLGEGGALEGRIFIAGDGSLEGRSGLAGGAANGDLKSPVDPDTSVKWNIPDALRRKVDESGNWKPYFGDTTVITLDADKREVLQRLQKDLYNDLRENLSEPILPKTFHITVHDLKSGENKASIQSEMIMHEKKCKETFKNLAIYLTNHSDHAFVELEPVFLFPSAHISLVMGFIPKTDRDFRIIMNTYNQFEEIKVLPNFLRMHVTIAYFKPIIFNRDQIRKIYRTVTSIDTTNISIRLNLWNIAYQHFENMNSYRDIFFIHDFR